jgi:CheY-like chemotaxis protein
LAADGAEAIRLLSEGVQFRAVVLDLMLPGVSGFTVLRHIEHSKIGTPVIVVSAAVFQMRTMSFDPNIVKAVIMKPFSLEEFRDALSKAATTPDDPGLSS